MRMEGLEQEEEGEEGGGGSREKGGILQDGWELKGLEGLLNESVKALATFIAGGTFFLRFLLMWDVKEKKRVK